MPDSKRTTVLHSLPIWLPQTQTWLYKQIGYLPDTVESHIVCEVTENLDQFRLANIHSLSEAPRWRYYWDKGLRRLRLRHYLGFLVEQAKRYRAVVLHSHFGNIGWTNIEAVKRIGLKHVVTFYGLEVNYLPKLDPRWNGRYYALFEQVDLVLCEGSHMAQCIADLGCPEHKIRVHHLGVAVNEIPFKPRTWEPDEPLRVLIAASFREKKGITDALEALGQFQSEVPLEITIIGDANSEARSQAEKKKILGTIEKHCLWPKVRMLGYQPHAVLLKESYRHHIFLSPSVTASDGDTEGGAPVSIIEMAASGMPIVSTRHCDIPQIVEDGVTGLLAEERDVEGLVGHLRWLVDHPNHWFNLSRAGRERLQTEFNARTQGEKLTKVYEQVLNGS